VVCGRLEGAQDQQGGMQHCWLALHICAPLYFVVVQVGKCFQKREAAVQFQNFGTGSIHAMPQRMQSHC
jgi:hypothetical protein